MIHSNVYFLLIICLLTSTAKATTETQSLNQLVNTKKYDEAILKAYETKHYLNTLIQKAKLKKLHRQKKWHMLVHYKSSIFGNHISEVDDLNFFMSDDGKHNPEKELEATLAAFFSEQKGDFIKLTPQCRFIARFHWLNQQLSFDTSKINIQICQKFANYKKGVNATSLTMIFPSAHPNGPASMFGHTSLKIDKKGQSQQGRMLDYTLNFAAMAGADRGIGYAIGGLTGEFKGQYSIVPYYSKIREYAQMESRDIWEYTLDLSQEQVDFIVMHSYELSTTYYDYYFFTENCSYHLLTLIESSMASQKLTNEFNGWVIPVDTLKSIDKNKLIKKVQYLPSLSSKIHYRRSQLTDHENDMVYDFFNNGLDTNNAGYLKLNIESKAKVLDLLYEYTRYKKIDDSNQLDTTITETERNILIVRSQLSIPSKALNIPTPEARPDQGHNTSRFGIEHISGSNNTSFNRIAWRSAYHGLLDPSTGFSPNYQLEFFNLKFSNEANGNNYKFEQLELLNITSLAPRDELFTKTSWRFKTGWKNVTRNNNTDSIYYFDVGLGFTYKKYWFKQTYLYGFIDTEIDFGDDRFNRTLFNIGPSIGALSDINNHWKAQLELRTLFINDPMNSHINEVFFGQNFALTKDISLNIKVVLRSNIVNSNNDKEITLSLNFFH